ncbi:hypothetical protein [Lampropedia puyangensis]
MVEAVDINRLACGRCGHRY